MAFQKSEFRWFSYWAQLVVACHDKYTCYIEYRRWLLGPADPLLMLSNSSRRALESALEVLSCQLLLVRLHSSPSSLEEDGAGPSYCQHKSFGPMSFGLSCSEQMLWFSTCVNRSEQLIQLWWTSFVHV